MNGAPGKLVPIHVVVEVRSVLEVFLSRLSEVEHAQENHQNCKGAIDIYVLQVSCLLDTCSFLHLRNCDMAL